MYCNTYEKDKIFQQHEYEANAMIRVVPDLLTIKNEYFNIKHSTFTMEAYKAGSCRQAMFTDFKINNSFTLENSFFQKDENIPDPLTVENDCCNAVQPADAKDSNGVKYDKQKHLHHFTAKDHCKLGSDLCYTLHKVFFR